MKRNESGLITLDQWMTWAAEGITMFPYVLSSRGWDRQEEGELPAAWTSAWEQASPYSFVLESGKEGRYTYLGLRPVSVLHGKDHGGVVTHLLSGATEKVDGSPLQVLQRWMAPYRAPQQPDPDLPPLLGGCVGFLGYDIVRSLEICRPPRPIFRHSLIICGCGWKSCGYMMQTAGRCTARSMCILMQKGWTGI
ncbi:hypothetical protein [Paenibacillus sp. AR247]|uniref:hypothetical protein n=1 Tax=Paenibacillus sp. AR247 TaxID=1631599 RepID=UPI000CFA6CE2|nr:hypothetical protein [Paenibacillus sp. AR247]PQP90299.1 hypothetical protein CPT76_07140 [Paenibacillus sp. AR247]